MQDSKAYEVKVPLNNDQHYQEVPPPYVEQANMTVQHVIIRQPALTDPPKDYLYEAIMVTICCFWPTGIFAILKAMDVQRAATLGDRDMAVSSSASARKFVCISLWVGVGLLALSFILCAVYVVLLLKLINDAE